MGNAREADRDRSSLPRSPVDGRTLLLLTDEQAKRLANGVKNRRISRGWSTSGGRDRAPKYSNAIYHDLVELGKRPRLGRFVDAWDDRMRWKKGSALALALYGILPVPLEDLGRRARHAIECRCAERGWNAAERIEGWVWDMLTDPRQPELPADAAALAAIDACMEWMPGSVDAAANGGEPRSFEQRLAALRHEIVGRRQRLQRHNPVSPALWDIIAMSPPQLPDTRQLLEIDVDMEWTLGSAARIVYRGERPVGLEVTSAVITIELDMPPGVATRRELWDALGEVTEAAEHMDPSELGRIVAVIRSLLRTHRSRVSQQT